MGHNFANTRATFIKLLRESSIKNESNKETRMNKRNALSFRRAKSEEAETEENKAAKEKMKLNIFRSKFYKKGNSIDATENEVLKDKRKDMESNVMNMFKKQWIIKKDSISKKTLLDKKGEKNVQT